MKQYLITFFVILSTITKFTYGQESWVPFNGGTEGDVELNILTSNTSEVLFTVNIPGMYVKDEMGYQRLRIEGCGRTDSTGFPELPLISHLIAVPECDSIIYNIQPLDSIILDNYNVYPAPELVEQTNPEGYTYLAEQFVKNDSIYNIDEYYPGYIGDLPVHGYIREQRIAETHLRPVQFNPVQQKLKIYFSIEVHLTFINPVSAVNVETGIFNGVCHTSLINYNAGGISSAINLNSTVSGTVERLTDTNTQYVVCDFLIISADLFFNNSFTDNLAWHRANYNGFDVKIINVSTITINPLIIDYEEIRDYLKNLYNNGIANHTYDGRMAYVCLIGDAYNDAGSSPMLPTSYAYFNQFAKASDYYYSCLTTYPNDPTQFDPYGDIWIGRLPVGNALELEHSVNKITAYEPIDENNPFLTILLLWKAMSQTMSGRNRLPNGYLKF